MPQLENIVWQLLAILITFFLSFFMDNSWSGADLSSFLIIDSQLNFSVKKYTLDRFHWYQHINYTNIVATKLSK